MRADVYLLENGHAASRTKAAALIESGAVKIDGGVIKKPSENIDDGEHEVIIDECPETRYVSRGGLKLEAALENFSISVSELDCIDIGASTGGFTDVLLRGGARRVYAVDSGHGQLHPSLISNPRVVSLEGVNARNLTPEMFDVSFDIAVLDVSFISQTLILPAIPPIMKHGGRLISLVKPQFEVGRGYVGRGGIVKNEKARQMALDNVCDFARRLGFTLKGKMVSPIIGGDGNTEFLVLLEL